MTPCDFNTVALRVCPGVLGFVRCYPSLPDTPPPANAAERTEKKAPPKKGAFSFADCVAQGPGYCTVPAKHGDRGTLRAAPGRIAACSARASPCGGVGGAQVATFLGRGLVTP